MPRSATVDLSLSGFGRQIAGGASRTAGLGLGFWVTARGSGVWMMRFRQFLFWIRSIGDCYNQIE